MDTAAIKDNAVTGAKIAPDAVGAVQLAADSVRAAELAAMVTVTNTANIANTANGSVTATCPAGTQVISGGGQPGAFGVEMTSSVRNGNGWLYQAKNNSGQASTITAQAYCLEG